MCPLWPTVLFTQTGFTERWLSLLPTQWGQETALKRVARRSKLPLFAMLMNHHPSAKAAKQTLLACKAISAPAFQPQMGRWQTEWTRRHSAYSNKLLLGDVVQDHSGRSPQAEPHLPTAVRPGVPKKVSWNISKNLTQPKRTEKWWISGILNEPQWLSLLSALCLSLQYSWTKETELLMV